MNTKLSDNTKAILLLTSPLLLGKSKVAVRPLALTEYNKLARRLSEAGSEPADLLNTGPEKLLTEWQSGFDINRIDQLLERGFLLSQAIERWQTRAIWVVSRADEEYPQRLKERLSINAPPVLYGCGNRELLETGGLAVVGSRHTSDELEEYARDIGSLAATAGCTIISGAARGIDQAAMHGALRKWGTAVGILSGDLERESVNREHREMLMEGQLVLVSPYDPKAGFNVGNAMQRNKLIYALADAGLVIDSSNGEGGTWAGAIEQLEKLRYVPIFTRSRGEIGVGLNALRRKGSLEWPNPETPDELKAILSNDLLTTTKETPKQAHLIPAEESVAVIHDYHAPEQVMPVMPKALQPKANDLAEVPPADDLFAKVEQLLNSMETPIKESDVIDRLQIEKKQAQAWLKRFVNEGKYKKLSRPVRYIRLLQSS